MPMRCRRMSATRRRGRRARRSSRGRRRRRASTLNLTAAPASSSASSSRLARSWPRQQQVDVRRAATIIPSVLGGSRWPCPCWVHPHDQVADLVSRSIAAASTAGSPRSARRSRSPRSRLGSLLAAPTPHVARATRRSGCLPSSRRRASPRRRATCSWLAGTCATHDVIARTTAASRLISIGLPCITMGRLRGRVNGCLPAPNRPGALSAQLRPFAYSRGSGLYQDGYRGQAVTTIDTNPNFVHGYLNLLNRGEP